MSDAYMMFPKHMSLHITHNQHKDYYERIEDYVTSRHIQPGDILSEDLEKILLQDSIWEVQWYPITPISFHWVAAATLERCLEIINSPGWS
jgi:hypothetical protein